MIVHVFNSSVASGPEKLVLPALTKMPYDIVTVFLVELRKGAEGRHALEYAKELGLKTCEITVRSRFDFAAIRKLGDTLKILHPEVAHAHDVKASTYLLYAAKSVERSPVKLISTHHGVRGRKGLRAVLYEKFYSRSVLPAFDRVLAVSYSDKRLLVDRGLRNVIVHRNGVDGRIVSLKERARRAARIRELWGINRLGISGNSVLLGIVGRIASEKRIDRALRVVSHLMDQNLNVPQWHLLIFGTGPLRERLETMALKLGISERVHWMGYNPNIGDQMAGLDLLLSLSDAEGLPITMLEAGWAGTPVFATDVDGNGELIPDQSFGSLVPVDESERELAARLAPLLRSKFTRLEQGQNFQRRVVAHFSGRRWADELACIYEAEKPLPGFSLGGVRSAALSG